MIVDLPRPGIVRMTLNRPGVLNAIDWQTLADLEAEVEKAAADPTARALVITGAGDRAFCSGADLNIVRELDGAAIREWAVAGHRAFACATAKPAVNTAATEIIRRYRGGHGILSSFKSRLDRCRFSIL